MPAEYQLSLLPRTVGNAEPRARISLESAQVAMGFIPNLYAAMANSTGLLESYVHGCALFRRESAFMPVEQEVVFLTLSRENGCHYGMAAHSFAADALSKVPKAVTEAIRNGEPVPDAMLAALSTFTAKMVATRGLPSRRDVESFLAAGYGERHMLDIILAIALKTMSSYSSHLCHTPVDGMYASHAWKA